MKAAALELGLPVTDDIDDVLDVGADLGVVVAYGRIIKPPVLERLPMVNLHFSLLPRWRGAAPVERAILAGDDATGVGVMAVEEGLDTGGIYAEAERRHRARRRPPTSCAHELVGGRRRAAGRHAGRRARRRRGRRRARPPTPRSVDRRLRDRLDPAGRRDPPAGAGRRRLDDVPGQAASRSGAREPLVARRRRRRRRVGAGRARRRLGSAPATGALELVEVQPEGKARQDAAAWRNGARPTADERLGA